MINMLLKRKAIDKLFRRILLAYQKEHPKDHAGIELINSLYVQILTIKSLSPSLFYKNIWKIINRSKISTEESSEKVADFEKEQ